MKPLSLYPIPLFMGPGDMAKHTYLKNWGRPVNRGYYIWYIQGTGKHILVDSGATAELMESVGLSALQIISSPEEGLARHGLKPEDIDIVIQTHLHLDHTELSYKYINARFFVQEAELEFALNPHPIASEDYRKQFFDKLDFEVVKGDQEIIEGVKVLLTPGHSPGGQSVVVETQRGKVIIPGFCCLHENFEPSKQVAEDMPVIPPARHVDLIQAYESILKVKKLADMVLPLHSARFIFTDKIS